MYETVLLPTDGSDGATAALDHAVGAAEAYGAALHVVSVVDRRVVLAADPDEKESVRADLTDEATEAVERLAGRAREVGIETTTAIPEGVPHREICAYADRTGADLLVIGTHGRTGRERRLNLGSTTERVVTDADRPLLVVGIGDGSG
jgi:nucleotide-binding universal stress UspA family protein